MTPSAESEQVPKYRDTDVDGQLSDDDAGLPGHEIGSLSGLTVICLV